MISSDTVSVIDGNELPAETRAYFSRIRYRGSLEPTVETLRDIHLAHVNAIPFENLSPLCGLPVQIDIESIRNKMITSRRGGYCFEHNHLFMDVLRALGFSVKPLAARVMWNVPEGMVTARGHMLLIVTVDGVDYLADTGFGGLTLPVPIRLRTEDAQETTIEPYRVIETNGEFMLQAFIRDTWKNVYRFTLDEQFFVDYTVTNYYLSTCPDSHFTNTLICARVDNGKRYSLRNTEFAVHDGGHTERRTIDSVPDLLSVLTETFGINVSGVDKLEERLAWIIDFRG